MFLGDTNQAICLTTSLISYLLYKYWGLVKDENNKTTWTIFINFVKTDLKCKIPVYIFAGCVHGINVVLNVFKKLSNLNLN